MEFLATGTPRHPTRSNAFPSGPFVSLLTYVLAILHARCAVFVLRTTALLILSAALRASGQDDPVANFSFAGVQDHEASLSGVPSF